MKAIKLEAQLKDELGKASNLALILILSLDEKNTPDLKKAGFGQLTDIVDIAKGVVDQFPLTWSLKGKKLILDYGFACENWEEGKDESPLNPKGFRYAVMEFPLKLEQGQVIKVISDKVQATYAIGAIADF